MRACPSGSSTAVPMSTPIRAICSRCCAHAAIGRMTVVQLRSVMNSRRLIAAPLRTSHRNGKIEWLGGCSMSASGHKRHLPRKTTCQLYRRHSWMRGLDKTVATRLGRPKSHSFSIARTPIRSVFTRFFSRRNLRTSHSCFKRDSTRRVTRRRQGLATLKKRPSVRRLVRPAWRFRCAAS